MPSSLCAWHQMGSFSPGWLNTGRFPQPCCAHCRLRACAGNTPSVFHSHLVSFKKHTRLIDAHGVQSLRSLSLKPAKGLGRHVLRLLEDSQALRKMKSVYLHHALRPVRAAEGGVLVAHILEGGVRGAVGVGAQAVPVVHHAL